MATTDAPYANRPAKKLDQNTRLLGSETARHMPKTLSNITITGMNTAQYTDGRLNAVNAIAAKAISNSKLRSRNLGMADNLP